MRSQLTMDRGFMAALLSASRLLVWHRCHVDPCLFRIRFTGKWEPPLKKAICMPETVIEEYSLEIASSGRHTPIHESLGDVSRNANLSESWHPVHRVGCADGSYLSARVG